MRPDDRSTIRRYGVAVALSVCAVVARAFLPPDARHLPFLLSFPAVMIAAWYGGLGPGLVTVGITLVASLRQVHLEAPPPSGLWIRSLIFCLLGLLVSALAEDLRRKVRRARQDAAERAAVERQLAERDAQLRRLANGVPALMSYVDATYHYRLVNHAYEVWFGEAASAIEGRHVRDVLGEQAWQVIKPRMEATLAGEVTNYEQELQYKTGARWVRVTYTPDRDDHGVVRGLVVLVHDISERKKVESALRRYTDRLERVQRLTEALSQTMTYTQVGDVIVKHAIEALDAAAGCVAVVVDGTMTLDIVQSAGYAPDFMDRWRRFSIDAEAPVAEAARKRRPVFVESKDERAHRYPGLPSLLPDGSIGASAALPLVVDDRLLGSLALTFRASRTFDEEDRQFLIAVARQCAQAIERARLYESEQQARAQAEASDRAKDQFLAVLSHELRTPLSPVLSAAQLIELKSNRPEEVRRLASVIRKNVELEARLIDDLLDLTRISRGKLSLNFEIVDVHAKIEDVLRACAPELEAKHLGVVLELEAVRRDVRADQARLAQVLWNLVKNAAKFSHERGSLVIRTSNPSDGEIAVEVVDQGIGIEPELLPRLFNAFEQGGREVTRRFGGLGLGLAVSKSLVEAQGGTITAASAGKDQGASFRVQLPLADPAARAVRHPTSEMTLSVGHHVLLVEDHADTAGMMAQALELGGYRVSVADSVASALRLADEGRFDVVVSDIGLPDGTGYELMRQLRARHALTGVAVSGWGRDKDIEEAKRAGFALHLTKPVKPDTLLAVLARLGEQSTTV